MNKEVDLIVRYKLCRSLELLVPVFIFFVAIFLWGLIMSVGSEPPAGAELSVWGLAPKTGFPVKEIAELTFLSGGVLGIGVGIGIRYTFTSVYKTMLAEKVEPV